MKGQELKERPDYGLMKQSDVVRFCHLQFPRWLIEDRRYMTLGMEAKFVYMLLFNRFQLSKHNGWVNGNGEVFVIYTRRELAEKLNISEKRVSAAMNELRDFMLIWEKRCGRGFANQIYLANVEVSETDAMQSMGGPLDPLPEDARTDETEGLAVENNVDNGEVPVSKEDFPVGNPEETVDNMDKTMDNLHGNLHPASAEPPERQFKNRQNGGSRTDEMAVQEPPNRRPSIIDFREKDLSVTESQSKSCTDGDADAKALRRILVQSCVNFLPEEQAAVMRQAIERLFYSQSLKIGDAVYPGAYIRQSLEKLDYTVMQAAVGKITGNTSRTIRNSSAYVVAVLFNTIMEAGSDLLVDPYLNFLRQNREDKQNGKGGG